jgi:hypothetical protein
VIGYNEDPGGCGVGAGEVLTFVVHEKAGQLICPAQQCTRRLTAVSGINNLVGNLAVSLGVGEGNVSEKQWRWRRVPAVTTIKEVKWLAQFCCWRL